MEPTTTEPVERVRELVLDAGHDVDHEIAGEQARAILRDVADVIEETGESSDTAIRPRTGGYSRRHVMAVANWIREQAAEEGASDE